MSCSTHARARVVSSVLLAILVLALVPAARGQQSPPSYVAGEVLIRFAPQATAADVAAIRTDLGATTIETFPRIGVAHLRIAGAVPDAVARYRGDARVAFVEPNYVIRADRTPNDTSFPQMWAMQNTGQGGGVVGADIDAVRAWDVTTGSPAVLVGVIDTGFDYTHPDLAANVWTNPGEVPGNGVDDDGNGYVDDVHGWDFVNGDADPMDDNGHGTHVSGTIGAVGNNAAGVVGVCWSVRIMGLKFLDSGGYGSVSNAILAMQYAARMGARILNNSWGSQVYSEALRLAVQDVGDAGILFVAAAGNDAVDDDLQPHYPSSYDVPLVVAVASTDRGDSLSWFSCWGRTSVDLAAPGSEILSTLPGGSYGVYSGTSMATPHVTGALALLLGNAPAMDGTAAKARLLATVDPLPSLSGRVLSGGRLNAYNLVVEPDSTPPAPIADLRVEAVNGQHVTLAWTATGDDGATGRAARYDLRYSTTPMDAASFASATAAPGPDPLPAGGGESARVAGLAFATPYWFAIEAVDEYGNASPISNVVAATTLGPPALGVSPDSIAADLFTGGRADRTLTVTNTGVSDLALQVTVDDHVPLAVTPAGQKVVATGHVVPLESVGQAGIPARLRLDENGRPDRDAVPRPGRATPDMPQRVLGTEVFGGMQNGLYGGPRARGNIFRCTRGTRLEEQRFYLEPSTGTQLWFLVYEGLAPAGEYRLISAANVSPAGPGAGWYSSGPLAVRFEEGRWYLVVASFEQPSVYYNQTDVNPYPYPCSFGELVASAGWDWAPVAVFPPDSSMWVPDGAFLSSGVAYYQTLVTRPGPAWLSSTPTQGTVPPAGSLDLSIRLDASGLNGGDYLGDVVIGSNDPARPESRTLAHLHVTGAPDLQPAARAVAFDSVYTGTVRTDTLLVRNAGTDLLDVTGIPVDAPRFSVEPSSFQLAPGAAQPVLVRFAPLDPGPDGGTLTLLSNDPDEPAMAIALSGVGVPPPDITVSPDSLAADLLTGGRTTQVLHVANEGASHLDLSITVGSPRAPAGAVRVSRRFGPATAAPADAPAGPRWASGLVPSRPPLLPAAVQEASIGSGTLRILIVNHYGYVDEIRGLLAAMPDVEVVDELDDAVPSLDLLRQYTAVIVSSSSAPPDPVGLGNVLADYVDEGGGVVLVLASFVSGYHVQGRFLTGGYMPFTLGSGPVGSSSLGPFDPSHPIMQGVTALTAGALGSTSPAPGAQWVASFANGLPLAAVQGSHVAGLNVYVGSSGYWTGQVPLLIHNAVAWAGGASWLAETPGRAVLAPGMALDASVTFDATRLYGGDYDAALRVASNDPDEPEVWVPAHLHVTGAPDIRVTPAAVAFDTVYVGVTRIDSVLVQNVGTDTLHVAGTSTTGAAFTADPGGFRLAPQAARVLRVGFAPGGEGGFAATLRVASDDADTPIAEVALSGAGRFPPIVGIAPDSLAADLLTGERTTATVTLSNTGGSDLVYSIRPSRSAGSLARAGVSRRITPLADTGDAGGTHGAGLAGIRPAIRAPLPAPSGATQVATTGYRVLVLDNGGEHWEIVQQLAAQPDVAVVDEFLGWAPPALDLLRQYDAAVLISVGAPTSPDAWGDVLADYVDGGGGLVMTVASFSPSFRVGGRLLSGGYFPLLADSDSWVYDASLGWYDGSHPIMQGVQAATSGLSVGARLAPGAVLVAKATNDTLPLVATRGAHVVGMNLFFGYPGYWTGDVPRMLRNAVAWSAGPSWLSATPGQGVLPPGMQAGITATLDAAGLYGGDYRGWLDVTSNDPVRPRVDVPVHLRVTGAPDIAWAPASLAFDTLLVGLARAETLVVRNVGTDSLHVSGLTPGDVAFTVEPAEAFVLAPTGSRTLVVRFAPPSAGPYATTLTVASDDPDTPAAIVPLSGVGLDPPRIETSPDSLTDSLLTNQVATHPLTIRNAGLSNLRFQITRVPVPAPAAAAAAGAPADSARSDRAPAGHVGVAAIPRTMAGAEVVIVADDQPWDAYSNEQVLVANGAPYDVIGSGDLATADLSRYRLMIVPSDQTTSFYDLLNAARARIEGWVQGGGVLEYHASGWGWHGGDASRFDLPGGLHVNPYLCPTNHVLPPVHPIVAGVPEPFTGYYVSHSYFSAVPAGARAIASDDLWRTDLAEYAFGNGRVVACAPTVEYGFAHGEHAGVILANMIAYTLEVSGVRWLTLDPSQGTVEPSGSAVVQARMDATGLIGGDYRAEVRISSDDPARPLVTVPAHLQVTGVPDLAFSPAALAFDSVLVGLAPAESLVVHNRGTDVLHVAALATGNAAFSVEPAEPFALAPGGVRVLLVRFAPAASGAVASDLTISSDDPDTPSATVPLAGIGVPPPRLTVVPDSLVANLYSGEAANLALTVGNVAGQSNLRVTLTRVPAPSWIAVDPAQATILPGASLDAQVRLDAAGLFGGEYRATVQVASNDPARPLATVPVHLHVTGRPVFEITPLSLDFGAIFLGAARTDSVLVRNTGTDMLRVSHVAAAAPFSADSAGLEMGPGTQVRLRVRFAPESPGAHAGVLTMDTNDPLRATVSVPLAGTGLVPPALGWSPDSLVASLARGEPADRALHLTNAPGTSDLTFTAALVMGAATVEVHPGADLAKGEADPRPGILGAGGPDRAGHVWLDSDQPGGPVYQWVDISQTGSVVPLTGDDVSVEIPIGFPFPFYGSAFGSVHVCSNGFLAFAPSTSYTNQPLPSPAAPPNLVAALWDDLYCPSGRVLAWSDTSRLVVSFLGVYPLGAGTYYDFQAILERGGRIVYQYRTSTGGWLPTATIGIQDGNASDGLTIACNSAYVHDGLAVEILPSYLTLAPLSGTIPPGGAADVVAHFDAGNLPAGEYRAAIRLTTNDPRWPTVTVPTHLDVTGVPHVRLSATSFEFGEVQTGTARAESLVVSNTGWAPLNVSGVTVSGPGYSAPGAGFVLAPQETRSLIVTFAPGQAGEASGSLVVHSDDPETPEAVVALHGAGITGPAAVLSPAAFEEQLAAGEVRNEELTIQNPGGMPLHWSIEAQVGVQAVATAHDPATQGSRGDPAAGSAPARDEDRPAGVAVRATADANGEAPAPEAATLRAGTAGARPAWITGTATAPLPALADVLTNLDLRFAAVTDRIPSRFDFEEGEEGNCIYDGGEAMFSVGNVLKTDRGTARLPYSNRALATSGLLGTTPQAYFTAKYPGLFVLAADLLGAKSFYTSGNLGADVSGSVDASELALTVNGRDYRAYVKRVYAGGTPSVNHLIVVPWSDSTTHAWSPVATSDLDRVNGLGSSVRIYYLLFGTAGGAYVDDAAVLEIAQAFLAAIEPTAWLSALPASGVVPAGGNARVGVTFDARGREVGVYRGRLVLTSDDGAHPVVMVPASLLVTGPTAITASLLSATAEPGRVRLAWSVPGCEGSAATVVRAREGGDWTRVASATASGECEVRFEDRDVGPGRYGYRLAIARGGEEVVAGETWVEVPRALAFALRGPKRNPAAGDVVVAFTLPDAQAARLELLDVGGRRLDARDVGPLGPGEHEVALGTAGRAPGVYLVRLTRAGRSLTSRVAVVR